MIKRILLSLKRFLKNSVFFVVYRRSKDDDYKSAESFVLSHYSDKSPLEKKRIEASLKRCYRYGGVYNIDYWRMHFEDSSFFEKIQFVPRCAQMNLYWQVNPRKKYGPLLENKGKCFQLFRKYYKRDLLYVPKNDIEKESTLAKVSVFLENHSRFMIKPLWGNCGEGIRIYESDSVRQSELLLMYPAGFVLEELIEQEGRMSSLYSNSVNTIRIITVNYGEDIEVMWPFMRVGRSGAVIDNAGAGGLIIPIDVHSGITIAAGDESCHSFQVHPDTNMPLAGFQIPEWDGLCSLVKEMAAICPDCHIMGWDMAFTDKGWVVVECNYGPDLVLQYVVGGVRSDFTSVRRKLHAKRYSLLK